MASGNSRKRRDLNARTADKYALYQESVQSPDVTVRFIERIYRSRQGRAPGFLREDFCGTGLLACHWANAHGDRHAVGLDIDPVPLAWGRQHNVEKLGRSADRIELVRGDVMDGFSRPADVVVAFNFSYCCFLERVDLKRYFRKVCQGLHREGAFILDVHGGPESQYQMEERRRLRGFTYVWDQGLLDAISNRMVCRIHFEFPDGSTIRNAFVYDWRIWGLPELRDLMLEAGFSSVDAYWEGKDDVYRKARKAGNCESWIAYLVAWKG